ncbi:TniQ family protein [Actinomadura sp. B10D3]|uniref:TniQ family protein n=1 Tax=Actinomadura sp. B10D3 TaxID=3153557 RepID=UPI00325E1880
MPRRLPLPVPPATGETVKSYLMRLATLHDVIYGELWHWVSAPINGDAKRRIIVGSRLAEATGYPLDRLAKALPELDPGTEWLQLRDIPQPACPRCTARHPGGAVRRLFPLNAYVCRRHRYWLGPPDVGEESYRRLDDLPELLAAQRKHRRLARLWGPLPVFDALVHAFKICAVLWKNGPEETHGHSRWWHWEHRLDQLIPKTGTRESFSHSRCYAAIYPEAVTIAALLAHPVWRVKATCPLGDPDTDHRWDFTEQFGRRLGLDDYYPEDPRHPVILWADHHAPQPLMVPTTFLEHRVGSIDGASPGPPVRALRKHHQAARYFAGKRYAANTLIYHQHPGTPVIETYYPRPGPYARQRMRLAAEAAARHSSDDTPRTGPRSAPPR